MRKIIKKYQDVPSYLFHPNYILNSVGSGVFIQACYLFFKHENISKGNKCEYIVRGFKIAMGIEDEKTL